MPTITKERGWEIAAMGGAVAIWTLFFVSGRTTLPSGAEAFDARFADRISHAGDQKPFLPARYLAALPMLPPASAAAGGPPAANIRAWPSGGSASVHLADLSADWQPFGPSLSLYDRSTGYVIDGGATSAAREPGIHKHRTSR